MMEREEQLLEPVNPLQEEKVVTRPRHFNVQIMVIMFVNLVAEAARGIVIPILPAFIRSLNGSDAFIGWCFAIFVVGRVVASLVFGFWSDRRSVHEVILLSMIVAFIGNVLWLLSGAPDMWPRTTDDARIVLFLGRLIEGMATGVVSCARALIVSLTEKGTLRDRLISWSMASQFIGFSLSPGAASAIAKWNAQPWSWFVINQYTSPSIVLALMNITLFGFIWIFIPHVKPSPGKKRFSECSTKAFIMLSLYMVNRSVMAIMETIGATAYMEIHHLDPSEPASIEDAGNFFLYLGLGGLLVYICMEYLAIHVKRLHIMFASFIVTTLGSAILINYDEKAPISSERFLVGAILVWSLGSPMCQVVALLAFSDVVGKETQGMMMGWFTVAGSVGSIFCRLLSGAVTSNLLWCLSTISSFLSAVVLLIFASKLVAPN